MTKFAIIDLDGTLYDRSGLARRLIWASLLQGRIVTLGKERLARKAMRGLVFDSEKEFFDAFYAKIAGVRASEKASPRFKRIVNWYNGTYKTTTVEILSKHYKAFPWVGSFFDELHEKGFKIVIYSDYGWVREKMSAVGIDPSSADYLVEAPSFGCLKGSKTAMERFFRYVTYLDGCGDDYSPEECIAVGDREDTDGIGAALMNIPFYLVTDGAEAPKIEL